ncbi:MAG: hypothetical protein WCJ35_29050, partial [Planctomycetota bacterium]
QQIHTSDPGACQGPWWACVSAVCITPCVGGHKRRGGKQISTFLGIGFPIDCEQIGYGVESVSQEHHTS